MANKPTPQHGRTLWDLIAEHPKGFFITAIAIILIIAVGGYFLIKNHYEVKTPYFSATSSKSVPLDTVSRQVVIDTSKKFMPLKKKAIRPSAAIKTIAPIIKPIPTISVSSDHQSGGQTAYQIFNGTQSRKLNDQDKQLILSNIKTTDSIQIQTIVGVADGAALGNEIMDYLRENGYKYISGVHQTYVTQKSTGINVTHPTQNSFVFLIGFPPEN